jgi:hypothetical protein
MRRLIALLAALAALGLAAAPLAGPAFGSDCKANIKIGKVYKKPYCPPPPPPPGT